MLFHNDTMIGGGDIVWIYRLMASLLEWEHKCLLSEERGPPLCHLKKSTGVLVTTPALTGLGPWLVYLPDLMESSFCHNLFHLEQSFPDSEHPSPTVSLSRHWIRRDTPCSVIQSKLYHYSKKETTARMQNLSLWYLSPMQSWELLALCHSWGRQQIKVQSVQRISMGLSRVSPEDTLRP